VAIAGRISTIEYSETFVADNISTGAADGIAWVVSSDSSDTAFARATVAGAGLVASGALHTTDNNMIEFCGDTTQFYAQNGHVAVECMLYVSSVADLAINFGFNDDSLDGGNTLPIELSGTTWTTTASTACVLVYDVDATNDEWHCMWVDDDVDTTTAIADLRMRGMAPEASKWMYLRVELHDRGSGNGARASFMVTQAGKSCVKEFNTNIDRDCALCWYLGLENRAETAHTVYVMAPGWKSSIAD